MQCPYYYCLFKHGRGMSIPIACPPPLNVWLDMAAMECLTGDTVWHKAVGASCLLDHPANQTAFSSAWLAWLARANASFPFLRPCLSSSSFFFSFSSLLRPSFCTAPRFVHLCSPRLRSLLQKHPFLLLFAPLFVSGQNV
jgi:hypothetical protein